MYVQKCLSDALGAVLNGFVRTLVLPPHARVRAPLKTETASFQVSQSNIKRERGSPRGV
jgi:hypothetical protein